MFFLKSVNLICFLIIVYELIEPNCISMAIEREK